MTDPTAEQVLILLRELQCRVDDLAAQVSHLTRLDDTDAR